MVSLHCTVTAKTGRFDKQHYRNFLFGNRFCKQPVHILIMEDILEARLTESMQ